jgi:PPM family protein phosphatase
MSNLLNVSISVLSEVGGRKRNEDSCGYWNDEGLFCCVLSDGAGGHGGGDVASQIAVETILESFEHEPHVSPEKVEQLIRLANDRVIGRQGESKDLEDMRATLVLLTVDEASSKAVWGHIGDSRLYLFRGGSQFFQTKDHSVFQSMIDAGFIKPSSARTSSQRTVLTGSLGGEDGFTPDVLQLPQHVKPGDAFLMCSDGFWEYVSESEMENQLLNSSSPQDWLSNMERVLNGNKREGNDNYSAIALWFGDMDFATRVSS